MGQYKCQPVHTNSGENEKKKIKNAIKSLNQLNDIAVATVLEWQPRNALLLNVVKYISFFTF